MPQGKKEIPAVSGPEAAVYVSVSGPNLWPSLLGGPAISLMWPEPESQHGV